MDLAGWATIATLAGVPLASIAAALAFAPRQAVRREVGVKSFIQIRNHLKLHWTGLSSAAVEAHLGPPKPDLVPLLSQPGWILSSPIEAGKVRLALREARPEEGFSELLDAASRYWPVGANGRRADRYTEAIAEHDRPKTWFDSTVYRLLAAHADENGELSLEFCLARYFDSLDAGEVLAYEAALRHLRGRSDLFGGPAFKAAASPAALSRRCAVPGVNTLTVRVETNGAFFFMHRRSASNVGSGMSATHVAPSGEFQPHADVLPVWTSDLDIARTVLREYAEEFLGHEDAASTGGVVIDYERSQPYARMYAAMRSGRMRLHVLCIGLNPLTWKPEICTVCVWEAAVFDRIFAGMLENNDEGVLAVGQRKSKGGFQGLPFTAENVLGYARHPMTLPEGQAPLMLAWRWRRELGIVK